MRSMKTIVTVVLVAAVVLLGGCQPWRQKYMACNADLENLRALFDNAQNAVQQCENEKGRLSQQVQMVMQELQTERSKPIREVGELEKEGGVYDPLSGTVTVTLANDLLFDSGKVTLKSQSKTQLDRISQIIKRDHGDKEVWVVGHTDADPIKKSEWKDNWQLSTERSLAVTRYLVEKGVAAKQLMAAGRGEFDPIGSSKSKNRRVEIVVHTR